MVKNILTAEPNAMQLPEGQDVLRDDAVVFCRGCERMLADVTQVEFWNGWAWCLNCYGIVGDVADDRERASRLDVIRDDDFDRR